MAESKNTKSRTVSTVVVAVLMICVILAALFDAKEKVFPPYGKEEFLFSLEGTVLGVETTDGYHSQKARKVVWECDLHPREPAYLVVWKFRKVIDEVHLPEGSCSVPEGEVEPRPGEVFYPPEGQDIFDYSPIHGAGWIAFYTEEGSLVVRLQQILWLYDRQGPQPEYIQGLFDEEGNLEYAEFHTTR